MFGICGGVVYPLLAPPEGPSSGSWWWLSDTVVTLYFALFVAAMATPVLLILYIAWQSTFRKRVPLVVDALRGLALGGLAALVIFLFYVLPTGTPYNRGALLVCLVLACVLPAVVAARFLNRYALVV